MKQEVIQPIGVIDALTAGINLALRYPWPLAIPVAIDLLLWLAPQLSVGALLQRLFDGWEATLRAFYPPASLATINEALTVGREAVAQVSVHSNLAIALTGNWLAAPSALTDMQASRLKLVSDGVLAPVGLGLNLPSIAAAPARLPALEVGSAGLALLLLVSFWLISQVVAAAYVRWAAQGLTSPVGHSVLHALGRGASNAQVGLFPLTLRFTGLTLVMGIALFILRLPLALVTALMLFSGGTGVSLVFVFSGGLTLWLTLWLLLAFFFATEALVLDGQPLWPSLWQSLVLVRLNGARVMGLVILVNLIMLGFRAVWGLIGQTPVGGAVAILGNAFLGTAMLYAIFIYYISLRAQATPPQPSEKPGDVA